MNTPDCLGRYPEAPQDVAERDCFSCGAEHACIAATRTIRPAERDPSGLDAHTPGAKLDDGKVMADLLEDFGLALMEVARVGTFGAKKYSRGGWQYVDQGILRYNAAKWRHALKGRYETSDTDSGLLHAAHEAWNALAKLELMLREQTDAVERLPEGEAEPA